MVEEMKELAVFPVSIEVPEFNGDWDYSISVRRCQNLFKDVREQGVELVLEFLHAHEMLVNKKVPGKTWTGFCKEVGVAHNTPYKWFDQYQLSYSKTSKGGLIKKLIKDKPLKKLTKPDVKFKLDEIKEEIKENNIADDDLKGVFDMVAEKIDEDIIAPRVVSKVETAVKKYHSRRRRIPMGSKAGRIELLNKKLGECSEELKLLVDGQIKMSSGDQKYITAIKGHAPSMVWSFHDLGVDIQKIWRMIIGRKGIEDGKEKERAGEANIQSENVIEVEAKVIS